MNASMSNIKTVLAGIAQQKNEGYLTPDEHRRLRLWFLAEGGRELKIKNLGKYCRQLKASSELALLLSDESARMELRGPEYIIDYTSVGDDLINKSKVWFTQRLP